MIYLIEGENNYEAFREYKKLIASFSKDGFEVIRLSDERDNLSEKINLTQNMGMFSKKTVYLVDSFDDLSKDQQERLKQVGTNTELIIYYQGNFDKRTNFYKSIKKSGKVSSFAQLKGAKLENWTRQKIRDLGLGISPEDLNFLLLRLGENQSIQHSELSKLKIFTEEGGVLDREAIKMLICDNAQVSVWELVDYLLERQKAKSLRQLDQILQDTEYEQIVGLLVSQLRYLYIALNTSSKDQMVELKVHPFVASKIRVRARNFSIEKLKKLYRKIVDMEIAVKSGKIDKALALDFLVLAF